MAEPQWNSFYFEEWVQKEGLDLIRGPKLDNVFTQPLKPWPRRGGYGVQIQLDGTGEVNAAYICEIPPGNELKPERHLYEELIYVLKGSGSTTVWYEGTPKNGFEWQTGSLFSVPLNAWHQHFNGSGTEPARFLAVTTAPIMLNLMRSEEFIFDNDAVFPDRYNGEADFFLGRVTAEIFKGWDIPMSVHCSNFFADINAVELQESNRGIDTRSRHFEIGNTTQSAHVLELPGGTFTKIHRHGPGAHVLWLSGEGYTLMWPDGGEIMKADWRVGSMVVPPDWWWHQHCTVSREPARHLALKLGSKRNKVNRGSAGALKSTRSGGSQMNYEDIPTDLMAELKRLFAEECARRGTPARMEAIEGG